MFDKKNFLGVGFTDEEEKDILEYILKSVKKHQEKYYIVTPNPEILVIANENPKYKKVLNGAKLALIDGVGIVWGAKLLGKTLKHKISGIDLVENLCKEIAEKPITVGFLGAGAGVAEKTADCLKKKYPGLKVVFAQEEWELKETRQPRVADDARQSLSRHQKTSRSLNESLSRSSDVKDSKPAFSSSASGLPYFLTIDILFVAFGSPKQEFWIAENLEKLPVKVAVGVGGAFDMISGKILRAPTVVRKVGLEWLFRLLIQPWRIKRQTTLLKFAWLIIKENRHSV